VALGVDPTGKKHLLGVREGATENATVVTELLADLVARGLDPKPVVGRKVADAARNAGFSASPTHTGTI
jgi:hypothetical protein